MHSRLFLFSTTVFLSISAITAFADSNSGTPYTLQVGAFPNTQLADKFSAKLAQAGEHPASATVELEGRGYWTRVFVGLFSSSASARIYGESLIAQGIISEFLVRKAEVNQVASHPGRVSSAGPPARGALVKPVMYETERQPALGKMQLGWRPLAYGPDSNIRNASDITESPLTNRGAQGTAGRPLAEFRPAAFALAPDIDTRAIPRPEPAMLAFRFIVGETRSGSLSSEGRGGIWLTGDTPEGLERLRWILGGENAALVNLDHDGRVLLDRKLLAKTAGLNRSRVEDALQLADYVSSNEGLLLLVQLAEGRYRYRIHIGHLVPTRGKSIEISGSINLDKNFDSRINTYRKFGKKLDCEQPPEGFDSIVGMNPVARWFNLSTNYWVQSAEILFHELAEAYAKLELGMDYLEQGSEPGAHALALDRERRLKSQRPEAHIVLTVGTNRVLRTQEEIRLFYAGNLPGASQH